MGLGELQFEFGEDVDGGDDRRGMRADALCHFDEDAVNLRELLFEQANEFVILLDGFHWLDENRLTAGTGTVDDALDAAFLLDLDGDDEALSADGDEFVLHGAAFGEAAQVSAQGFLNGATLLFHFAADAGKLGRGFVFERSIRLNLVAEVAQEFREVDDLSREAVNFAPVRAHGGGGILGDLPPLGGAIDDGNDVANLECFERGSGDARFGHERSDIGEGGKIEATADAAEFANLSGKQLLGFDPLLIGGGSERIDAVLAERRGRESAQELAQRIEFEHTRGGVEEIRGHHELCYRTRKAPSSMWEDGNQKPAPKGEMILRLPRHA